MAYATISDLITRFGQEAIDQLATRGDGDAADAEVVAKALSDATDEIDGYLRGRYPLPLDPVPSLVNLWCATIARYRLWGVHDAVPEAVLSAYTGAVKDLERVARGDITLPIADATAVLGTVRGTSAPRVLTPERMKGFTG